MYTSNPPTTRYMNSSIRISDSEDDPLPAGGDIEDDDSSAEEDAIEAIVCGPEPPAKRKKWIEARFEKPYTPSQRSVVAGTVAPSLATNSVPTCGETYGEIALWTQTDGVHGYRRIGRLSLVGADLKNDRRLA